MAIQQSILFPDTRHTFADFFCGCGGLSLGFIQAGLKCVSAMDIAPEPIATYWYNLCYKTWSHLWVHPENERAIKSLKKHMTDGETSNYLFPKGVPDNWLTVEDPMPCLNLFCYSIMDLEPEQWMELCGVRPGDIRIFAGGPPCQGFSTANSNRSIYDERNQLPLRYLYYAKVCKPDYILIENVPGLVTLGKKKGDKHGPFVDWIAEAVDDAGYNMSWNIHNAADYGVPQKRERVLFFGARKGLSIPPIIAGNYGEGPGKIPYQTVLEAIGHLPAMKAGDKWDNDPHPYGYDHREGYVICPECLEYNKEERETCIHCGCSLANPIRGGVLKFPGLGLLLDCQKPINNDELYKIHIPPEMVYPEMKKRK